MGSPRIPDKSGQDLHESGSGREFLPWSFASGSLAGVSPLRFVLTTLAALLAAGVTFSLGCWQLDRAAQKQALFDAVQRQQALAPWDGGELSRGVRQALAEGPLPPDMLAGLLHRPVRLQGHWLPEQTLYLDNRQMNGKAGFFVLTPLRLAAPHDQVVVAVQRGWAPRNFLDRKALPPVQTPASLVQIEGRIEAFLREARLDRFARCVVVGHGYSLRVLAALLLRAGRCGCVWRMRLDNGSLSAVDLWKEIPLLAFSNDTLHLHLPEDHPPLPLPR